MKTKASILSFSFFFMVLSLFWSGIAYSQVLPFSVENMKRFTELTNEATMNVTIKDQKLAKSGDKAARTRILQKGFVEPVTKMGYNYDQTIKESLRKFKEEDYTPLEIEFVRYILIIPSDLDSVEMLAKSGDISPSTAEELRAWIKAGGLKGPDGTSSASGFKRAEDNTARRVAEINGQWEKTNKSSKQPTETPIGLPDGE